MKIVSTVTTTIFLIPIMTIAQIQLAGEQTGVFDSTYIVIKNLIVPENKKLEFLPGSRLFFMPFTSLKVFGQLKIKDAVLNAFDTSAGLWNGIEVIQKGSIDFENVTITRSVLGVSVPDSAALIKFRNIKFQGNTTSLRIADEPVFVQEEKPVTIEKVEQDKSETENPPLMTNPFIREELKVTTKPGIVALRWISAITAISCTALWAHYMEASDHYRTKYDLSNDKSEAQSYRSQCENYHKVAVVTGIGAGIFSAALLFSITIRGCYQ